MMRTMMAWVLVVLMGFGMGTSSVGFAQSDPTPRPRPTRYPRPDISRPTRTPRTERPARPERPTRVSRDATPTPTLGTSAATFTPTATRTPVGDDAPSCANACAYDLSQMRLTWYDAASGGLNLSFYVQGGSECPALTPEAGELASIQMTNWLTERKQDTGRRHVTTFVLGANGSGSTSNGGTAGISQYGAWQQFSYRTSTVAPIAGPEDGADFPVVFDLCVTVGNQAIKGRMVCQEKNRGLLCHEG